MEKYHNLVALKITEKEDDMVDLEYYTADGKQPIVSMRVHVSALPPLSENEELSPDEYTAFLQLLVTPYGHLNLLERWLNWASNSTDNSSGILNVSGTKRPEVAILGLIQDTKNLLGIK